MPGPPPVRDTLAVSVVMPAYNEAELLELSVKEVTEGLRGRRGPFELIIVENGSQDATPEIADRLSISYYTVETHRKNICEKLGLHGSHALVRFALEHKTELP